MHTFHIKTLEKEITLNKVSYNYSLLKDEKYVTSRDFKHEATGCILADHLQ